MLVLSKLFNFVKTTSFVLMLITSQGCFSKEKELTANSLQNPDELEIFVRNGVSNEKQILAQELYIEAVKRKKLKNNWGAASKYFGETALIYPTAKSLIGLSESEAKFYTQSRFGDKAAIKALEGIEKYLKGAIAVDSIQNKLTQSEIEEVNNDIACISAFLKSKIKINSCKYIDYVYQEKKEK